MSSSSRCASPEAPALLSRRSALAALLGAAGVPGARAQAVPAAPAELQSDLPSAHLQGQGRLRFFGLHVYDIRFWTAAPLRGEDPLRKSAALEIEYARALKGPLIAERSLTEMQRVGEVSAGEAERWLATMTQLFPDVKAGDRITGIHRPGEGARFHVNGRLAGEVRDASFARLFFAIWLSPRTSEPQLRAALLGTAP
jgi:Chalcone isomerase-like